MSLSPALSATVMLLRWSENSASGPTVTFLLNDPADLECFRGATTKKGGHAGQVYACVLVEVDPGTDEPLDGDDGGLPQPLETNTAQALVDELAQTGGSIELLPPAGEGKAWWQQADGTFKIIDVPNGQPDKPDAPAPAPKPAVGHFPNGLTGLSVRWCLLPDFWQWLETEYGIPVADESTAKDLVCSLCYCQSRKELNDDPVAAANFEEMVKVPYSESRRARGLDA